MPRVTIQAFRGRTPEQKRELARRITEATVETFKVNAENVIIVFDEIDFGNYSKGGVLESDRVGSGS